jgi:hypothetical protein
VEGRGNMTNQRADVQGFTELQPDLEPLMDGRGQHGVGIDGMKVPRPVRRDPHPDAIPLVGWLAEVDVIGIHGQVCPGSDLPVR